ncbi:hypothetical protein [uncultured Tenacibaculum sp.]|uniref:hypothetical protein n=1 Tax=uncultured Tenacibaculum sp. TaxID=174713 RepID=UPI0026280851|nr:hypothetical protein [uncultured Tenacibaculum sp.]
MENLQLHSSGLDDHFESIKQKYNALKKKIKDNDQLNVSEKKTELEKLNQLLKKEKQDLENNLY